MTIYDLAPRRMGTVSSPGLNPATVAGLALWLNASHITGVADGGEVASWPASNAADAAATGIATARPLYIASSIGGFPAARFDGVNDMLKSVGAAVIAALTGTDTPNTVLAVLKKNGNTGNQILWGASKASSAVAFHSMRDTGATGLAFLRRDDASTLVQPAQGLTINDTNPHVITFVFTGTAGTGYKDGTAGTAGIALNVGVTTLDQFTIGARDGGAGTATEPASVDIAEIMVFAGALSTGNRQLIERAWGAQYGITVA
jgi:hypothetical protein